jgi:MoaA/NifB/PqqE/SkfB family radical SAM enzyme
MIDLPEYINVIDIIDAGDVFNDQFSLYKFLYKNHKPAYANNDALVIYTKYMLSDAHLDFLYKALAEVDISECFITVVGNTALGKQIASHANTNQHDFPIKFLERHIAKSNDLLNIVYSNTLCPLLWSHLVIQSNREVSLCCQSETSVGNADKSELNDIFNNESFNSVRQSMLNNKWHESCKTCRKHEGLGMRSMRQELLKLKQKEFFTTYVDDLQIRSLDLKADNVCNFRCRICNSTSSSAIAAETNKANNIKESVQVSWSKFNQTSYTQIFDLMPNLTHLDLYGGEPMLSKSLKEIVRYAVVNGYAKNISLHYNTNGSIYDSEIIDLWKHFKEINVQLSIDNVGKRFELERAGGIWQEVENNIKQIKSLDLPNLSMGIWTTVSIMNILYLDDIINWAKEVDIPITNFSPVLPHTKGLSFRCLTANARKAILEKYANTNLPIINMIKDLNPNELKSSNEFIEYTQKFDQLRNERFSETHSEIAALMGYKN